MESPNYPSNSKSTPPPGEPKKVEKVVTGEVKSRQKSLGKRLKQALIGGDSKTAVQYVIAEVVIPQAKDMIAEAVTQAFERFIFGESRSTGRRPHRPGGYTNYSRYSQRAGRSTGSTIREERQPLSLRSRDEDELVFETRTDAHAVLEQMYDFLEEYRLVSRADLMSMVGKSSTHTDHKWGWEDLQGSDITKLVGGGYVLTLPKTIPLD